MGWKRITTGTPNFLSLEHLVFGGGLFHASAGCSLLVQPEDEPHDEII